MGAPGKLIRLMVSLLILKQLHNLSDESVVEYCAENVFYQSEFGLSSEGKLRFKQVKVVAIHVLNIVFDGGLLREE